MTYLAIVGCRRGGGAQGGRAQEARMRRGHRRVSGREDVSPARVREGPLMGVDKGPVAAVEAGAG